MLTYFTRCLALWQGQIFEIGQFDLLMKMEQSHLAPLQTALRNIPHIRPKKRACPAISLPLVP